MRRVIRRRQLVTFQPLTFSPFSRVVAWSGSVSSKVHNKRFPANSVGDILMKKKIEVKKEKLESSDEEEFDVDLQKDFEFFDPKEGDFHGVKTLLQTYLGEKEWDLSGFVDLILGQTTVGAVVKINGDEDNGIFSVVSALNLARYKDHKCMTELKGYLFSICQKDFIDNLRSLFEEEAHNVALLVSQRVTNLPPQLLPHIYDGLFDEITWATEDEETEELKKSFCFKFYILVSKIYMLKNVDQKRRQRRDVDEEIIYVKPEDEIFHELCSWSFCFALQTAQPIPSELRNYRRMGLVMAVEADKIPIFRQKLQSLLNES